MSKPLGGASMHRFFFIALKVIANRKTHVLHKKPYK
nr:MAG TPA: hypothetical protein [Caudoviricetes sp.]